jgi:hypothetical protein
VLFLLLFLIGLLIPPAVVSVVDRSWSWVKYVLPDPKPNLRPNTLDTAREIRRPDGSSAGSIGSPTPSASNLEGQSGLGPARPLIGPEGSNARMIEVPPSGLDRIWVKVRRKIGPSPALAPGQVFGDLSLVLGALIGGAVVVGAVIAYGLVVLGGPTGRSGRSGPS